MRDLLQLVPALEVRDQGEDALLRRVVEALLRPLVHLPAQPGAQANGAEEPDRVFEEAVVAHQPQRAHLDISHAVGGIHQQAVGALVQREGHGVNGKVTAAQVFEDVGPLIDRVRGLGKGLLAGARYLQPHPSGIAEEERLRRSMRSPVDKPGRIPVLAGCSRHFLEPLHQSLAPGGHW